MLSNGSGLKINIQVKLRKALRFSSLSSSLWSVCLCSFSKAGADAEWRSSHDGDSLPAGGGWLRPGQSVLLHLQRTQGPLPEHKRAQRTLPVELHCW